MSQEGQGRKGTESGEATVVRRGVRKKRNRIRRGHCVQERSKEGKEQDQERPLWSGEE